MSGESLLTLITPHSSFLSENAHKATVDNLAIAPLEKAEFVTLRVNDHRDVPLSTEIIAMDKQIVAGKKNAEIWMSMVPANDYFVRVSFFDLPS